MTWRPGRAAAPDSIRESTSRCSSWASSRTSPASAPLRRGAPDSLSICAFLHYELTEKTPDHSSFTVIRQRLALDVYDQVFGLVVAALHERKFLRGKHLGIDTSVLEADAWLKSLKSLTHRLTGRAVPAVREAAGEAGKRRNERSACDPCAVSTFDRKRTGRKTSNKDWQNPHDPDAKVGLDKKGATRMLYKPEHVVDLETGAIVDLG